MKKVMIVGASVTQVPLIQKAKELGYRVGVIDVDSNAVGIKFADNFFNVSTIDKLNVLKATKNFKADGITTVATDMPIHAIAYTCEQLGLNGVSYDTAVKATDKAAMIKCFEEYGVPRPWYHVVRELNELKKIELGFPCVCKPVDNSGSRGVVIVNQKDDLQKSFCYSSQHGRSGTVIIEEMLIGDEISVEAFAINGDIHVLAITDKKTTGAPHFVEISHSQPSKFIGEIKNSVIKNTKLAMRAVGIENGPAHVEIMITKSGPKLIELGARLGGDFITTDLVPLSTGIDMLKAAIDIACGEKPDIAPKFNMGSAIRFIVSDQGRVINITGINEARKVDGVKKVECLKNIGDMVAPLKSSLDRVGYVVAQAATASKAVEVCEKAVGMIDYTVEKE